MRADFGVKETLANDFGAGQREAAGDDREIRAGTGQYRSYDVHEICCCMEICGSCGRNPAHRRCVPAGGSALQGVSAKPTLLLRGDREQCAGIHGGFDYGSDEAGFEAKASEGSCAGVGSRWRVFVAGERRIGGNRRFGDGHAVEGYRDGPGVRSQRGRDLRRQPRNVLSSSTRRMPAHRGSVNKWPEAAAEVAAAAEAAEVAVAAPEVAAVALRWLRWLRLLLVVGILPHLLTAALCDCVAGWFRHGRVRSGSTRPSCVGCGAAPADATHFACQMPAERMVIDPASRRRFG